MAQNLLQMMRNTCFVVLLLCLGVLVLCVWDCFDFLCLFCGCLCFAMCVVLSFVVCGFVLGSLCFCSIVFSLLALCCWFSCVCSLNSDFDCDTWMPILSHDVRTKEFSCVCFSCLPLLAAAACCYLLKCVAHPWTLRRVVKPRQGRPSSVIPPYHSPQMGGERGGGAFLCPGPQRPKQSRHR